MLTHEAPRDAVDVLIAEDDAPFRRMVRLLLEGAGFHCAEAGDGTGALDLALHHSPRCVLLDLGLPGLDGLDVARRLRSHPRTSAAHIHCLTGRGDPLTRQQAARAGCEAFLTKPVDEALLLAVVRRAARPATESGRVDGLTFAAAEGLLDWLERQGCSGLEVSCGEGGFAVRCLCPPGFRLHRDGNGDISLVRV
jgi:CheY-like chemotaxis protein